jgi:hypothetical protein
MRIVSINREAYQKDPKKDLEKIHLNTSHDIPGEIIREVNNKITGFSLSKKSETIISLQHLMDSQGQCHQRNASKELINEINIAIEEVANQIKVDKQQENDKLDKELETLSVKIGLDIK